MDESTAREILGLKPRENPHKRIRVFQQNLERKQAFVDNAPSQETRARLQQELDDYRQAIVVVSQVAKAKQSRQHFGFTVCLVVIAVGSIIAWGGYQYYLEQQNLEQQKKEQVHQEQIKAQQQRQVARKVSEGDASLAKRKWSTARKAYEEALAIDPHSQKANNGIAAIELGITEERNQKIHYTLGNSRAAMEAGLWDRATMLVESILKDNPDHVEARKMLKQISRQRHDYEVELLAKSVSSLLDVGKLPEAQTALANLKTMDSSHPEIANLSARIDTALSMIRARERKAAELLQEAKLLDNGQFSAKALQLLNQARQLDSNNRQAAELYEKMSRYSRSIRVPVDKATISEAITEAKPRDRIVVAPGIYREALVLNKPIHLEGAPDGKTVIKLPAGEAPVITILKEGSGSHLSQLTLEHEGFDHSKNRSSALIIQGAEVSVSSCIVNKAAGHGIAVIDGGKATISGCKVGDCGWDGISIYGKDAEGKGSQAKITSTYSQNNLQHGIEFWKGGGGEVSDSRVLANGLCGILAMSQTTRVSIQTTLCARNRGAGILASDQAHAIILANRCDKNLLSGIVARGSGTNVSVSKNITMGNGEVGILIYQGVTQSLFKDNQASGNKVRQIWMNATSK